MLGGPEKLSENGPLLELSAGSPRLMAEKLAKQSTIIDAGNITNLTKTPTKIYAKTEPKVDPRGKQNGAK